MCVGGGNCCVHYKGILAQLDNAICIKILSFSCLFPYKIESHRMLDEDSGQQKLKVKRKKKEKEEKGGGGAEEKNEAFHLMKWKNVSF